MLKKAGIIVAAAAAGLLAVSPLAFAGDKGDYDHGHHGTSESQSNDIDRNSSGIVNVADNEVNVPIQACNNNVNVVNLIPVSDVTAALGILGNATSSSVKSCEQSNSSGGTQVNND